MGNYLDKLIEQGEAMWNATRFVRDNWQNVFTGLGTSRDKTTYGRFIRQAAVPETELMGLYHEHDMAKRIVMLKPQEMLRKGFAINIDDDSTTAIELSEYLMNLKAGLRLRDAMIWGRLLGGGAVIVGADDGSAGEEPLNEENIRSIKFLHVVDKRSLIPNTHFSDPLDELFGEAEIYTVHPRIGGKSIRIHRSRLLLFGGAHTHPEERDRLGGWDYSVLNAVYPELRRFDAAWQAAEHLMTDASQAVFKIQGLMSMIAGGQKEVLQTRMQLVDMSRSVARALLLDADGGEEFTRQSSSFTDASVLLEKFMLRFAAAAEMPVTLLMGQSPAGMNATGESDFRWFYDTIKTAQKNELLPELQRLVRLAMLAQDSPTGGREPESWSIVFAPLWEMTPSEQADLEKKTAERDVLYINADVLLPEEVALSRFTVEGWSAETSIDRELRETMLKESENEPVDSETPESSENDEEDQSSDSEEIGDE